MYKLTQNSIHMHFVLIRINVLFPFSSISFPLGTFSMFEPLLPIPDSRFPIPDAIPSSGSV
jgi:hypothetical protein